MLKKFIFTSLLFCSSFVIYAEENLTENKILVAESIPDSSLVIPENIERNFDELLQEWKEGLYVSSECAEKSNEIVSFDDSIYIKRLYGLPTEMELVYNSVVRSYIDMYTGRMRSSVQIFLGKSEYYFPMIEQILDKYGLPLELKYLPIIESALNPTIVSRAGATGLWQFMLGTGKMYDLEINTLVDERRDPVKATDAAARFLKDLYGVYGDWNLVIAAYNCGPGNVNKAIKRSGGETDYWSIYPYLPKETRGYVPAFIAATYVMNFYQEHNICPVEYNFTKSIDTIIVDKNLHLEQLSEVLDISVDDLRILNPQFKKDIIPADFKSYVLLLPSSKAYDFELAKDTIYSYKAKEYLTHRKIVEPKGQVSLAGAKTYKVRRGDNLAAIAGKFGITVNQLKGWNGLKSNRLRVGQRLAVSNPVKKKIETDNGSALLAQNKDDPDLDRITQEKDSIVDELKQYLGYLVTNPDSIVNNLSDSLAMESIDQVTQSRMNDLQSSQTIYHKVRIGETLTQIANKYDVDKDDIIKWNKLKKTVPQIGTRLMIHLPRKKESSTVVHSIDPESVDDIVTEARTLSKDESNRPSVESIASVPDSQKLVQKTEKKTQTKSSTYYVVKKGDTLGGIAAKYGNKVTVQSIKNANGLKSNNLKIGQRLKIPR